MSEHGVSYNASVECLGDMLNAAAATRSLRVTRSRRVSGNWSRKSGPNLSSTSPTPMRLSVTFSWMSNQFPT